MPSRPQSAFLLLLAAAACGRCGRDEQPAPPRAVALVNGEGIAPEALRRELALARGAGEGEPPAPELKKRALDGAVDRLLLLQEARARRVAVSDDEVEQALLRLRADYPGTHFDDLLAQERLSAAELRARLRDQLAVERLFAAEVFPAVRVSDDEVQRWYDEHLAEFDEPEQVRARQVVVRTREEAVKVREELRKKPQAFAEVAKRASIAPEGKRGGDLGFFFPGSGMPEVFDVCFKLPPKAISEVTPSPYGFHLFQVTERKPAVRRPLAAAREPIRERLLRERRARAQEEYLAALRAKAQIQIDQKALDALAP